MHHTFKEPVWYGEAQDIDEKGNLVANEIKDKPTVCFVFASWCPHCSNASPALQEFAEKHADKCNVVVFQSDGERQSEKDAVKKLSSSLSNFRGFPHFFGCNKNGNLSSEQCNGRDLVSLEDFLQRLE